MKIASNAVVSIHYTLKNAEGEVLDSSEGADPLNYLHGAGNIIPGLEKSLEGKLTGDELTCLLYTSPSPRDLARSRMPSSA